MTPAVAPRTALEALLPPDGAVPLALVYDTANLAGLDDQPVRLAIRRAVAAGDVVQAGRGRAGTVALTDAGRRRLARDRIALSLAFAQDAGDAPWDGRWHLVALTVPERERAVRDALRRELLASGAAAVATSLYVSPHDLTDVLPAQARSTTATAVATTLDVRGVDDPLVLAETLWPAGPVVAAYDAVTSALAADGAAGDGAGGGAAGGGPCGGAGGRGAARTGTTTEGDAAGPVPVAVRQLRLADALERAMRDDPLLPPGLRPEPWPPAAARRAWRARWDALRALPGGDAVYRGWLD
ncbi:PaaX family transcriptional regulator [Cellulomonas iranensis]|uniref:Phenylacetic acid degradation operon negative regulatory protein n=1 Tax=Cellulomonas iranensis TaxID=76862 RepID=A0ABU0GI96_9CELL|nr:PaaX family transcriptional regulator [Cellulomonas iranensis]MDQ0425099.1 phenylacetic acid degradation operon negative regulatory protein [Cellulomonas iranensis]